MGEPDTDVRAVSIGAYGFCYSILNVPYQELTQLSVATKRQCLPSRLPHCGVGDALTCQLSTKKDLRALPGGLFEITL